MKIYFLLIVLLFLGCIPKNPKFGKYLFKAGNSGFYEELTINRDSSFEFKAYGHLLSRKSKGIWLYNKNAGLILQSSDDYLGEMSVREEKGNENYVISGLPNSQFILDIDGKNINIGDSGRLILSRAFKSMKIEYLGITYKYHIKDSTNKIFHISLSLLDVDKEYFDSKKLTLKNNYLFDNKYSYKYRWVNSSHSQ